MTATAHVLRRSETLFDALTQKDNKTLIFLFVFLFIMFLLLPLYWLDNEVSYFDLGRWLVTPDGFSEHSAVFDNSAGRIVGLGLIGVLAEVLGPDAALIVTRIAAAVGFSLALTALAAAWSLSAAELLLALAAFMLLGQNYFAGEWIFKGFEPKIPAYILAIFAVALVARQRYMAATICMVVATYFHFLVGGFWILAVLLLIALQDKTLRDALRLLLIYVLGVSPLIAVLLYERLIVPTPDTSGFGLSLNEIYSVFRNPHHVAPFLSPNQFADWIPGISGLLAALLVMISLARGQPVKDRIVFLWLACLNGYLLGVLALAFIDRNSHLLGAFYMFRPNSLILLLSLIILAKWLSEAIGHRARSGVAVLAVATLIAYTGPHTALSTYYVMKKGSGIPIQAIYPDDDAPAMLAWIRQNTEPDAVVVIQHVKSETIFHFWQMNFERLIERPTLVNWKFVPTAKGDLARWYGLITWRDAVFSGDCSRIAEQPVDYLVTLDAETRRTVQGCGTLLWSQGEYGVVGQLIR